MTRDSGRLSAYLLGEPPIVVESDFPSGVDVDSLHGTVRVEWDRQAAMTPLGQLPFFIVFSEDGGAV